MWYYKKNPNSIVASPRVEMMPFLEFERSPELHTLTGLRALAAWWVVLLHLRPSLFVLFPSTETFLLPILGAGYMGVDLFFILSGFIISYQYASWIKMASFRIYIRFLWKRVARIYPVHLFTLIVMLAIVSISKEIGFEFTSPSWLWNHPERFTFGGFVANMFLIQAWEIPVLVTWNPVAWSLSCEWLAYILFPLVAIQILKINRSHVGIFCIVVILLSMALACSVVEFKGTPHYAIFRIVSEFAAGCMAYRLYQLGSGSTLPWDVITSIALIGVIVGSSLFTYFEIKSFWITPLLVILIYGLAVGKGIIAKMFQNTRMIFWGRVSYSLYMTHLLCIIILDNSLPLEWLASTNGAWRAFVVFGYVWVVGVIAQLTYHWVEEPSRRVLQRFRFPSPAVSFQS